MIYPGRGEYSWFGSHFHLPSGDVLLRVSDLVLDTQHSGAKTL